MVYPTTAWLPTRTALTASAGLLLAFGAVAQGGGSARDAGYPSEPFDIHIDSHPPKVQYAVAAPIAVPHRRR